MLVATLKKLLAGDLIEEMPNGYYHCYLCGNEWKYKWPMHVWMAHPGVQCYRINWDDALKTKIRVYQRVLRCDI